jgi:hypothetical protein
MEKPPSKANSFSARQETPCFYGMRSFFPFRNSPLLASNQAQMVQDYTFISRRYEPYSYLLYFYVGAGKPVYFFY